MEGLTRIELIELLLSVEGTVAHLVLVEFTSSTLSFDLLPETEVSARIMPLACTSSDLLNLDGARGLRNRADNQGADIGAPRANSLWEDGRALHSQVSRSISA